MKCTSYKLDKIFIALFLISIYTPFIAGIIQEDKIASAVEKRNLTTLPLPPTSIESLSSYPKRFNDYYSDHFGFREELTKAYFKVADKLRTRSSFEHVTTGQDGWFFLGSIRSGYTGYSDPIGDAIHANLFTKSELKEFAKSLTTIKNWLGTKGIEYIYVIAPNKHTIYFEYLPEYISKINDISATDQLVKYLREHTDVTVVDLRQALMNEKKKNQVYFKTDTHWNQRGANVAQFEIMKKIKSFFPDLITPFLLEDDQLQQSIGSGGDLAGFAKLENIKETYYKPMFAKEGCTPLNETSYINENKTHTLVCEGNKLNTIIFRDSFFSAMQPYISRQFNRSTYIWEKISFSTLKKYIEKENPDIVIDEVVERSFPYSISVKDFTNTPQ